MITDYHVHLETGPYTIEWLEKYVEVAIQRGITDLGFSEHGYRFKQSKAILYNPWIAERQTEDINEYVNLILQAKEKGIDVKLGIELDFIPGKEKEIEDFLKPYPWDYVIGSVHWIDDWGFDLTEMREKWNQRSILKVYEEYFWRVERLLESMQFDILGHVDVIKVFGHRPSEEEQEQLLALYDRLVPLIQQSGITVEMSTAGLRKPVGELYPAPLLMERLTKAQVPMMINSDAHRPEHVGEDYDKGIDYLRSYGVNEVSIFEQRKRKMVPLG
ncbi:histidinol-phosphatase HisJ family protein [Tepidibacillus fermentans]|uniref:Histidinol-phosphatase n=1 Tax=Tepidibacillus fermentans TaxID=1281767 RepID=A0A4V6NYZ5_9BACI|nr:histidinol-phosphatase HisJ family protein [Tepidibacillus fermentans]TCS82552.1 histidinol-phosphatase (PHP family) [Tepidibacillus fermentans]